MASPKKKDASWSEVPAKYKEVRTLGEGTFGRVFLAVDSGDQRLVAVKVFKSLKTWEKEVKGYLLVEKVCGDGIVCTVQHGPGWIAMQYVEGARDGGELLTTDEGIADLAGRKSSVALRSVFLRMCGQLARLVDAGLALRDIKPSNTLIDLSSGTGWFIDLGFACEASICSGVVGTPTYMSPEVLECSLKKARTLPHEKNASILAELWHGNDAWSLAMTFADLATAKVTKGETKRFLQFVYTKPSHSPSPVGGGRKSPKKTKTTQPAVPKERIALLAGDGKMERELAPWRNAFDRLKSLAPRDPAFRNLVDMISRVLLVRAAEPEYSGWQRQARQRLRTLLVQNFAKRDFGKLPAPSSPSTRRSPSSNKFETNGGSLSWTSSKTSATDATEGTLSVKSPANHRKTPNKSSPAQKHSPFESQRRRSPHLAVTAKRRSPPQSSPLRRKNKHTRLSPASRSVARQLNFQDSQ